MMQAQDAVICLKATRQDLKTKPAPRFTEGTLQRAMENIHKFITEPEHKKMLKEGDGIGTSATPRLHYFRAKKTQLSGSPW
ncbi:hypothetical protein [Legionella geestiana]|uniref:hypothetical protein n=1 Tax=Legionella geestiana TaxID=45065 RepID=UPI000DF9A95A|nr:hypothetical protein [Legionella geestiana]STX59230.1 DNA topoisomerase [Legionella geestiana]